MTHTPFVSNPCPATAIVFVSQNLFYGQLPQGDQLFADRGDGLDAADDDNGGERAAHQADDNAGNGYGDIGLNDLGNGVDLGAAADAEGGDHREYGKEYAQPFQV